MANKQNVIAQLDAVTDRLSSQVRTTALAVLALSWGLLVGDSPTAKNISVQLKPRLILLGAAAVTVLFLDFLQYFAGYFSTKKVLDKMESTGADDAQFDYGGSFYRLRVFFFWAKQVVLILAVAAFLAVLGRWLLYAS